MNPGEPADKVLVARARVGDAAAYELLVRRYARQVYATALAILANRVDAEDVSQDVWIQALVHLDTCRNPDRFAYWLFQIVRNRARNYLHYRRVRTVATIADSFGSGGPGGDQLGSGFGRGPGRSV